jgi:site-specific recombinase
MLLDRLSAALDRARAERYLRRADTPNGSTKLQSILQALDDAQDTLQDIHRALADGDHDEAKRLAALGHDSLLEHINELREIL